MATLLNIAQFRTGSHWLNIETGRHRKQDRKDRTCPMCTHRIINPGLPPEELDAFGNIVIFSRFKLPLLETF